MYLEHPESQIKKEEWREAEKFFNCTPKYNILGKSLETLIS